MSSSVFTFERHDTDWYEQILVLRLDGREVFRGEEYQLFRHENPEGPLTWQLLDGDATTYFNESHFLLAGVGFVHIIPHAELIAFWQTIREEPETLFAYSLVLDTQHMLSVWLRASGYEGFRQHLGERAYHWGLPRVFCSQILAEDPSLRPSIKDTIAYLAEERWTFDVDRLVPARDAPRVTVFLDEGSRTFSWPAALLEDPMWCLLGQGWMVRIHAPEDPEDLDESFLQEWHSSLEDALF